MEERTVRLLRELSIFCCFIFFIKMSSAASVPTTKNIMDIIKGDKNVQCKLPQSIYDSNIIKDCYNLTYPENTTNTENRNTILCIAFHDMLYKICSSNITSQIPNDNAKFKSYMEKFFPENNESRETRFCENIKGVKVAYKQLLPLLSPIHFNESIVCHIMCFDIQGNFNPLCAILALSKKIDDDIKDINKSHQIQSQTSTVTNGLQQPKSLDSSLNPLQTLSHANSNDKPAVEPKTLSKTPESSSKISNNEATSSKNQDKTTEQQNKMLESEDKPKNLDKAPETKENAPETKENAPETKDNGPQNEGR